MCAGLSAHSKTYTASTGVYINMYSMGLSWLNKVILIIIIIIINNNNNNSFSRLLLCKFVQGQMSRWRPMCLDMSTAWNSLGLLYFTAEGLKVIRGDGDNGSMFITFKDVLRSAVTFSHWEMLSAFISCLTLTSPYPVQSGLPCETWPTSSWKHQLVSQGFLCAHLSKPCLVEIQLEIQIQQYCCIVVRLESAEAKIGIVWGLRLRGTAPNNSKLNRGETWAPIQAHCVCV